MSNKLPTMTTESIIQIFICETQELFSFFFNLVIHGHFGEKLAAIPRDKIFYADRAMEPSRETYQ